MKKKKKLWILFVIVLLSLGVLTVGWICLSTARKTAIGGAEKEESLENEAMTEEHDTEAVVASLEEATEEATEEAEPADIPDDGTTENTALYGDRYEDGEMQLVLQNALDSLEIGYTMKADSEKSVTGDVVLPTTLSFGEPYGDIALQWSSSKEDIIAATGAVTRSTKRDERVLLTVQATLEEITCSRELELLVVHAHNTDISSITDLTLADIRRMNSNKTVTLTNENRSMSLNARFSDLKVENSDDAKDTLYNIRSILGIENVYEELEASQIIRTEIGDYYRFEHYYNGCRVYGRNITVSTDNDNYTDGFNAGTFTTEMLRNADLQVSVSMEDAEVIAATQLGEGISIIAGATEQIIYTFNDYYDMPATAYLIKATDGYIAPDVATYEVIVSARDGAVISVKENNSGAIEEGSGKDEQGETRCFPVQRGFGCWKMVNDARNIKVKDGSKTISYNIKRLDIREELGGVITSDVLGDWDATAVSAYANMIDIVDWYEKYFGVVSYGNFNEDITVLLNMSLDGGLADHKFIMVGSYEKALKDGKLGTAAGSKDCLAHEYTHAYVENLGGAPAQYDFVEVGTINEGYADFVACLIDDDDGFRWGMFEDWLQGKALSKDTRNVAEPWSSENPETIGGKYYWDPEIVGNSVAGHQNSTIISHSLYQILQTGISEELMAKIVYQSIACGYSSASTYGNFYNNIMKSATKLQASGADLTNEDIELMSQILKVSLGMEDGIVNVKFADESGATFSSISANFDYIDWLVKGVDSSFVQFGQDLFSPSVYVKNLQPGKYEFEAVIKSNLGTKSEYEGTYMTGEFEVSWTSDYIEVLAIRVGEPDAVYASEMYRMHELKSVDKKVADMLEQLRQEIVSGETTEEIGNAVITILDKSKELFFVTATDNSSMFGFADISEKGRYVDLGMDYYTNIINRYNTKGGFGHYLCVYMGHHIGPADRRLQKIGNNLNLSEGTGQLLTTQSLTDNQKKALLMAGELLEYFYDNRGNMEQVFTLYEQEASKEDSASFNATFFRELTGYEDRMKELTLYKQMIVEVPGWITELKNSVAY